MFILSKLTLSSAIAILCFSFSAYSKDSYSSSKDGFINQTIPLSYKANKFGILNIGACDFMVLPFLPKIACELIEPVITDYLKEQATIEDKETIEILLKKKEIDNILELGAKKGTYYPLLKKIYTRDIFGIESKTTIVASFKSTVKCGVDLNKGFDVAVEHQNKKIILNLPAPTFLSNEVTMISSKDDEGVFAPQLSTVMYNDVYESAKAKAIEYALADNLKNQAKENIKNVFFDMLPPLASSQFDYNLIIVFQDEKLKINQENKTH